MNARGKIIARPRHPKILRTLSTQIHSRNRLPSAKLPADIAGKKSCRRSSRNNPHRFISRSDLPRSPPRFYRSVQRFVLLRNRSTVERFPNLKLIRMFSAAIPSPGFLLVRQFSSGTPTRFAPVFVRRYTPSLPQRQGFLRASRRRSILPFHPLPLSQCRALCEFNLFIPPLHLILIAHLHPPLPQTFSRL